MGEGVTPPYSEITLPVSGRYGPEHGIQRRDASCSGVLAHPSRDDPSHPQNLLSSALPACWRTSAISDRDQGPFKAKRASRLSIGLPLHARNCRRRCGVGILPALVHRLTPCLVQTRSGGFRTSSVPRRASHGSYAIRSIWSYVPTRVAMIPRSSRSVGEIARMPLTISWYRIEQRGRGVADIQMRTMSAVAQ
jgi:hypothetical protein